MKADRRKLLYVVGGRRAAPRVDVAVLFGEILGQTTFDIDWVVFDPEGGAAWRQAEWHGARSFWIGGAKGHGLKAAVFGKACEAYADLRTFLLALRGDYELIQVRDKFVSAVLCLIAARLRGIPYTYWLSYPFPESRLLDAAEGRARVKLFSWAAGRITAWLLYRVLVPAADHVFVQSEQMLEDVAAASGASAEKMTAVPMGVDAGLLELPKADVIPNTVLYLGTLARVRRLDMLLEAMAGVLAECPDAQLVFVGEGDTASDREFLESRARQLGIDASVRFLGRLPMGEALARAQQAAVCVSPFYPTFVLRSTSPTKLVEYMALGRPVVANDHPEQARVIAESGAGLCVPWGSSSFCTAILTLLKAPDEAERMGDMGPPYVRKKRTYASISRNLRDVYRTVLKRRPE